MTTIARTLQVTICQNKKTCGIIVKNDNGTETIEDPFRFVITYDNDTSEVCINDDPLEIVDKDNLEDDQKAIYDKYVNSDVPELIALLNANLISFYQDIETPDDFIIIELLGELIFRIINPDKNIAENYIVLMDEWQLCLMPNKVTVNLPNKGSKLGTFHILSNIIHTSFTK